MRGHPPINGEALPLDATALFLAASGWWPAQQTIDALNGADHPDTIGPTDWDFLDGGVTW